VNDFLDHEDKEKEKDKDKEDVLNEDPKKLISHVVEDCNEKENENIPIDPKIEEEIPTKDKEITELKNESVGVKLEIAHDGEEHAVDFADDDSEEEEI
jgi:hypothetical protein